MSPRNHADCTDHYCTAVLIITKRSLLAQFGLTPKSKRGMGASEVVGLTTPQTLIQCE